MWLLPLISPLPPAGTRAKPGRVISHRGRDGEKRGVFQVGLGGRGFDLNTKKHLEPNQQQIVVPS